MRAIPIFPLFVPADRPERYEKALAAGSDSVIVDLEDAVAATNKGMAREHMLTHLPSRLLRRKAKVFVRINGSDTSWHEEDVSAVKSLNIDGVVLPKAERPEQFKKLRDELGDQRSCLALVETAVGLAQVRSFAAAADQLLFGSLDLCVDLGCAHERDILLPARFEVVLASRLAGLPAPLDGVTTDTTDGDAVSADARYAARLGFAGKLLIHPSQISPARSAFTPTDEEIDWAEKALKAEAQGVATLDGKMIDAPVIAKARAIISRSALYAPE